eukprot:50419_1
MVSTWKSYTKHIPKIFPSITHSFKALILLAQSTNTTSPSSFVALCTLFMLSLQSIPTSAEYNTTNQLPEPYAAPSSYWNGYTVTISEVHNFHPESSTVSLPTPSVGCLCLWNPSSSASIYEAIGVAFTYAMINTTNNTVLHESALSDLSLRPFSYFGGAGSFKEPLMNVWASADSRVNGYIAYMINLNDKLQWKRVGVYIISNGIKLAETGITITQGTSTDAPYTYVSFRFSYSSFWSIGGNEYWLTRFPTEATLDPTKSPTGTNTPTSSPSKHPTQIWCNLTFATECKEYSEYSYEQDMFCCSYVLGTNTDITQTRLFDHVQLVRDLNIASLSLDWFFVIMIGCILSIVWLRKKDSSDYFSSEMCCGITVKYAVIGITVVGSILDVCLTMSIVGVINQNDLVGAMNSLYQEHCYSAEMDLTLIDLSSQFETIMILDVTEGVVDIVSLLILFIGKYIKSETINNCTEGIHAFMFAFFDLMVITVNVSMFVIPSYNTFQATYNNEEYSCFEKTNILIDL